MKYFTMDLISEPIENNSAKLEKHRVQWRKNMMEYWDNYEKYEDRFPIKFNKEYCKHAFHDFNIDYIKYNIINGKRRNQCNIDLKISYDDSSFLIKYIDVSKYEISVLGLEDKTLLYNEILPITNSKMSHEIILVDLQRIYIEFKKIKFKKIKFKKIKEMRI